MYIQKKKLTISQEKKGELSSLHSETMIL